MAKSSIIHIGVIILGLAIAFLYVSGCIHSQNKHPNDSDILRYTPFSVYRGVEMFWHKDYAGVDWKEKVKDDINTSISLLSAVTQPYDLVNTKEQIENFSKQLSKYPQGKRKEIASTVRAFLNFGNMWTRDLIIYLENYESDTVFKFSPKSQQVYDSLQNYYQIDELAIINSVTDSISKEIREYPENRQMYISRLKGHDTYDNSIYDKYFYKLFSEHLQ